MTIDVRPRPPATPRNDDPARRPAPPRPVPSAPAKAPPQPPPPVPARTRTREAQAAREARQADLRRDQSNADPQAPNADLPGAPRGVYRSGERDGAGAGSCGATGAAGAAGDVHADAELEAGLHALDGQQGIFELLLPGGQTLGVVVQSAPGSVHFLLSAGGSALEQRLRQNKMELERRLQQRMQKDVRVALL